MGREGSRQAYPSRVFVPREATVARRTTEKSWAGRVLPHQPECWTRAAAGQGSVEGGARADRVESGGRWPLGDRREEMGRWPQPTDESRTRGAEGAGLRAVAVWACWCCPSEEHKFAISPRLKVVPFKCYFKFGFG